MERKLQEQQQMSAQQGYVGTLLQQPQPQQQRESIDDMIAAQIDALSLGQQQRLVEDFIMRRENMPDAERELAACFLELHAHAHTAALLDTDSTDSFVEQQYHRHGSPIYPHSTAITAEGAVEADSVSTASSTPKAKDLEAVLHRVDNCHQQQGTAGQSVDHVMAEAFMQTRGGGYRCKLKLIQPLLRRYVGEFNSAKGAIRTVSIGEQPRMASLAINPSDERLFGTHVGPTVGLAERFTAWDG